MTVLRKKRILALALAGLLILSGCGSAQSSKGTEEGSTIEVAEKTQESSKGTVEASSVENDISADDTLTIAIADEINNIDIIHAYSHWVNLVLNGIVEGLFYYDNDSHIQSRLVESYDQPDDKTYVYHIKRALSGGIPPYQLPTALPFTPAAEGFGMDRLRDSFWIRMLFSCLVDADYLDTETFMSGGTVKRSTGDPIPTLLQHLWNHLEKWQNPSSQGCYSQSRFYQEVNEISTKESQLI